MAAEDEIGRYDWHAYETYQGRADELLDQLRELIKAEHADDAERLRERIERAVVPDGAPCAACLPVTAVLVAALPEMPPTARVEALDLLAVIGPADPWGPPAEQVGLLDVDELRRVVARGFDTYRFGLRAPISDDELLACIDLVSMAAEADPALVPAAIEALEQIPLDGRSRAFAELIENTVRDLRG
ncbi:MAG: hypothetical protein ABW046_16630 [Actinoplanes sp.]